MLMAALCFLCSTLYGADANDVSGLIISGLGMDGIQEGRVGYYYAPWAIEPFAGGFHVDEDDYAEEWGPKIGVNFHAVSAEMLAQIWKLETPLPDGDGFVGPFGKYGFEREEWSGGIQAGVAVDLGDLVPAMKGWQSVTEYQLTLWNRGPDEPEHIVMVGFSKRFR